MRAAARVAALALLATSVAALPPFAFSRTYLCFFDAGTASIGAGCQAIVVEIAKSLREPPPRSDPFGLGVVPSSATQVELIGYADGAEASTGKASLSRARAEAVASLLRANGVPADRITTSFLGATRPLAPAAVAEPQNRRVEFRYR